MATDKPNHSRSGCTAEGDVFERATMASVVGRGMNLAMKLPRYKVLYKPKRLGYSIFRSEDGKMLKVTFKKTYQVKEGRKMAFKTSQWEELIKNEADAKLRAMALNWEIVKMEVVNG